MLYINNSLYATTLAHVTPYNGPYSCCCCYYSRRLSDEVRVLHNKARALRKTNFFVIFIRRRNGFPSTGVIRRPRICRRRFSSFLSVFERISSVRFFFRHSTPATVSSLVSSTRSFRKRKQISIYIYIHGESASVVRTRKYTTRRTAPPSRSGVANLAPQNVRQK